MRVVVGVSKLIVKILGETCWVFNLLIQKVRGGDWHQSYVSVSLTLSERHCSLQWYSLNYSWHTKFTIKASVKHLVKKSLVKIGRLVTRLDWRPYGELVMP